MSKELAADRRRSALLREMGLAPLWRLRGQKREESDAAQASSSLSSSSRLSCPPLETPLMNNDRAALISQMGWEALRASIADCRACDLCRERKQAVPGVGDETADWLFVGEAPGAEEDARGEPFVGQAGKLLDAMLNAMGLRRGENVYIANAVKCRPPGNATPSEEAMSACRPYLERQIELLQPRLIVALGRPAAQTLLRKEVKIADVRGKLFQVSGIPLIVTYHPAYLLRTLADKAKAWEDLCLARRTFRTSKAADQ